MSVRSLVALTGKVYAAVQSVDRSEKHLDFAPTRTSATLRFAELAQRPACTEEPMEHSFRPTDEDAAVVGEAVSRMLVPIGAWFESNAKECEPVKTKSDLADALVEHRDGYAMAKFLERSAGWEDIDAELVALLDGGCATLRAVFRNAVCEWVKKTGLRPAHKIGDTVTYAACKGTILRIRAEEGVYEFLSDEHAARRKSIFTTSMLAAKVPFEEIDGSQ